MHCFATDGGPLCKDCLSLGSVSSGIHFLILLFQVVVPCSPLRIGIELVKHSGLVSPVLGGLREDKGRCDGSLGKLRLADMNDRAAWSRDLKEEVATKRI